MVVISCGLKQSLFLDSVCYRGFSVVLSFVIMSSLHISYNLPHATSLNSAGEGGGQSLSDAVGCVWSVDCQKQCYMHVY